jgi:hypothetical protein
LDGELLLASDNPGDNVDYRRRWMGRLSGDKVAFIAAYSCVRGQYLRGWEVSPMPCGEY